MLVFQRSWNFDILTPTHLKCSPNFQTKTYYLKKSDLPACLPASLSPSLFPSLLPPFLPPSPPSLPSLWFPLLWDCFLKLCQSCCFSVVPCVLHPLFLRCLCLSSCFSACFPATPMFCAWNSGSSGAYSRFLQCQPLGMGTARGLLSTRKPSALAEGIRRTAQGLIVLLVQT